MINPDAEPAPDPLAERNAARRAALLAAHDSADAEALLRLMPTPAERRALATIRAARAEMRRRQIWWPVEQPSEPGNPRPRRGPPGK